MAHSADRCLPRITFWSVHLLTNVCRHTSYTACNIYSNWLHLCDARTAAWMVKIAHTQLPVVDFRSWSRFLAVSLQVKWVINPAVGCHYFLPGLQLPSQPLRGLLPILLLGEQRHDGCEQFALDCYPTASRLRFEPRTLCTRVQHANHSATEPLYAAWQFKKWVLASKNRFRRSETHTSSKNAYEW